MRMDSVAEVKYKPCMVRLLPVTQSLAVHPLLVRTEVQPCTPDTTGNTTGKDAALAARDRGPPPAGVP